MAMVAEVMRPLVGGLERREAAPAQLFVQRGFIASVSLAEEDLGEWRRSGREMCSVVIEDGVLHIKQMPEINHARC